MDEDVFRALADPTRRALLDRLFENDGQSLSQLEAGIGMTRFGVMKHLRVLEDAGVVVTRKAGRERLHYLNPVPIQLIYDRWIGKYAPGRLTALADLKSALEEGEAKVSNANVEKPELIYQIFIKAPPEKVWDGLIKPEFTTRYFHGSSYATDWQPGSSFVSSAGGRELVTGRVLEYDPPRRLVHTWHAVWDDAVAREGESRVAWELEDAGGGMTKLTVVHDQFANQPETYKQVSGGWMWIISNLKTLLETGDVLPAPVAHAAAAAAAAR